MKRSITAIIILILLAFLGVYHYLLNRSLELIPNNIESGWDSGSVFHIIPAVNHNRILLKVSFIRPLTDPPLLEINNLIFTGHQTDTKGYFWYFDAANLYPNTEYSLLLRDNSGYRLCDPWKIKTFPSPDDKPDHLRLLIYSGFGGHDINIEWFGTGPLPLSTRIRLLKRALSLKPDAVISLGNQIIYDLRFGISSSLTGNSPRAKKYAGTFDRTLPVLGTGNERTLKKAVGPQIAYLYGTALKSTPAYFILDSHDYFEGTSSYNNPEKVNLYLLFIAWREPFIKHGLPFPPDKFMLELAKTAQLLYLPEFLPDENRPLTIPDTNSADRAVNVSECYGTLRYGKLFEGLIFETKRFIDFNDNNGVLINPKAEKWIISRIKNEDTQYKVCFSPSPFGWISGNPYKWYKNRQVNSASLTGKDIRSPGWFLQHNRILEAASGMENRIPLIISGNSNKIAMGKIISSGDLFFKNNPVYAVTLTSLGRGPMISPFPAKNKTFSVPEALQVYNIIKPVEQNGFIIADFTHERIKLDFYTWTPGSPVESIDTLKPFYSHIIENSVK